MILVSGDALYDLFLGAEDGPAALTFDARAGGSPLNVAIGLARMGAQPGFFTAFSRDLLGTRLRQVLAAEGVDTRYALTTDRLTTVSLVGLDPEGVPAYAFHSAECADTGITADLMPELGAEVTGLHFGSYSIAVTPVADTLAKLAVSNSARFISLDPNIRLGVEPAIAVWHERLNALMPHVDLLKISAEDLEMLHPGETPESYARRMLSQGPSLVVVTDGGETVRAWGANELVAEVQPPAIDVVDTVGAGDTFMACLLFQLSQKGDPKVALADLTVDTLVETLQFCATAAAITSTRRGADLPTLQDVTTFLRG
jgi:fructokinase